MCFLVLPISAKPTLIGKQKGKLALQTLYVRMPAQAKQTFPSKASFEHYFIKPWNPILQLFSTLMQETQQV